MNRLLEKCALLMLCMFGFVMSDDLILPVAALLISAAATSLAQIFSGKKTAAAVIAGWAALCGCMPLLFCALPLMIYDALYEKKWWLAAPAAAALIHMEQLRHEQLAVVCIGICVGLIIHMRVSSLEKAVENLKMLRDEITEKNIQLTAQNIRLAETQDNEVRIATLKERNRIAREIHDNVGHMLTRSILQIGALQIINQDSRLCSPLGELKDTLDGAMTSIRTSVHNLHDNSIDLKKAITEMTDAIDEKFDVSLHYDAEEHIAGATKLCIAGVVKEGISNAVRHSNGNKISIILREHPAFYQLLIEDNGTDSVITHSGIGLKNMESRVASLGGRITFTASGKGFHIFITLPKER